MAPQSKPNQSTQTPGGGFSSPPLRGGGGSGRSSPIQSTISPTGEVVSPPLPQPIMSVAPKRNTIESQVRSSDDVNFYGDLSR